LWGDHNDEWLAQYAKERHGGGGPLLTSIQRAVRDIINRLRSRELVAYVVGGTLRDLISDPSTGGNRLMIPRDIDIIVANTSVRQLESCFSDLISRRTRFGGLHLVKNLTEICEVHFDVWPLAETWAFKQYEISPDISRFPGTPFLNLDAVAVELFPALGRPRMIHDYGFFEGMISRKIDINFEPNPFPDVCVIRALIMAAKLQFTLTRRLAAFILKRLKGEADVFGRLQRAQISHYGQIRCSPHELDLWFGSIQDQMDAGADGIEVRVSRARQAGLWQDHPPSQRNLPAPESEPDIVPNAPRAPAAV
jgi:hypothetical protein